MDSSAADTSVDVLALYPEAVRFHVCETMVEAIHAKMEAGSAAFAAVTETPRHVAFALEVVGAALSLPWTAAGDRVVAMILSFDRPSSRSKGITETVSIQNQPRR